MNIHRFLVASLALAWLAAQSAVAEPAASVPRLQTATFANGLKLVVEEDHAAPVAVIEVWHQVGGRDEIRGKTGLAHVLEHMSFKGSTHMKPGEYSKRIAAMGGVDNAFTATDYTAYFEIIPSEHVDEVLGMEAERFARLTLDAKEYAKEIRVIMEERRMRTDDDPNSRMFEELSAVALRLSPYRNPVIGWMQDLRRLTIEDVRAFYRRYYVPGNAVVVIVGDVDFAHVKRVVGRTLGRIRKRPAPPRFRPVEPEPLGSKRMVARLPGARLPMTVIAMPVPAWRPGRNDREAAALTVATEILSGGRSAVLTRRLVDEGRKAFSAGAGYDPFSMDTDLWNAYGMLGPKQTPEAFERAFWRVIRDMAAKGPTPAQLAAAKRRIVADEVFAQDSLYLRAREIGEMESVGIGANRRGRWLALLRAVSADDVRRALKRWIRPERATTGVLLPKKTPTPHRQRRHHERAGGRA